ncbi:MAG: ABC-2 transporter permease [Acutalibacter sp.]|nr:ABC-2 transporter permease [Acutalibacter sp.]
MKGLLLKDWYMVKKYCKVYLVIAAFFIAASFASDDNLFFVFYPCLLCGMIPVNLLGYDERSRWVQYSGTLPYTKAQFVSAKYLVGLLAQAAMLLVTGIAQGIKMSVNGNFVSHDFLMLMLLLLTVATVTSSISLPFIFKLGVEKGRIAYYAMVGFICAASAASALVFKGQQQAALQQNVLLAVSALAAIGIYLLSWYLSIVFYKNREIT